MTETELNEYTNKLRKQAFETRKAFSVLERTHWIRPTVEELLEQGHEWESWYAWRPVQDVHGVWHWGSEIYRMRGNTYVDYDNWSWYHYGTFFDVIKDIK